MLKFSFNHKKNLFQGDSKKYIHISTNETVTGVITNQRTYRRTRLCDSKYSSIFFGIMFLIRRTLPVWPGDVPMGLYSKSFCLPKQQRWLWENGSLPWKASPHFRLHFKINKSSDRKLGNYYRHTNQPTEWLISFPIIINTFMNNIWVLGIKGKTGK